MPADTRREQNRNFIAWQAVKAGSSHYTPSAPLEWTHEILESIEWPEMSHGELLPADQDIALGRVKTFDSIDDMIAGLKEPW